MRRVRMVIPLSIVLAGSLAIGVAGGPAPLTALAAGTPSGSTSAAATSSSQENRVLKDEAVYARLTADGAVKEGYVVNVLKPEKAGTVTDFGSYAAVQNLTNDSAVTRESDAVTMDATADSFSYQGDLENPQLPWLVSIFYTLDGKKVDAADLGGASGTLGITIATKKNPAVDATFYDNYLLQITLGFTQSTTTDVKTDDGQIALAGSDVQVTFTGMPGKDGSFTASAHVSDYASDGITIAAVPFSLGIAVPDTTELVSGFKQLGDGVSQIKTGVDGVASGASGLSAGAQTLSEGTGGLAAGTASFASGLETYQQALAAQAAASAQEVDPASASAAQVAYGNAQQAYLGAFLAAYTPAYTTKYAANIAAQMDPATAMADAMQAGSAAAAADATVTAAQGSVEQALSQLVNAQAANAAYGAVAQSLDGAAQGVGTASDASTLLGGASSIAAAARQLAAGTGEFAAGAGELASGAAALATGTGTLATEVQAMPDKVQQQIDEMMKDYDKSDFVPVSFASPRNVDVELVQFALKTDPITRPEVAKEQAAPQSEDIWTRIAALFGAS